MYMYIYFYVEINYWITQQPFFFFRTTCSTCPAWAAGETTVCWISTGPLVPFVADPFTSLPLGEAFNWFWEGTEDDVIIASFTLGLLLRSVSSLMGFPSLINSTIWSASLLRSPSGRNGLSHPSTVHINVYVCRYITLCRTPLLLQVISRYWF